VIRMPYFPSLCLSRKTGTGAGFPVQGRDNSVPAPGKPLAFLQGSGV
jgi:hypothetical protein